MLPPENVLRNITARCLKTDAGEAGADLHRVIVHIVSVTNHVPVTPVQHLIGRFDRGLQFLEPAHEEARRSDV